MRGPTSTAPVLLLALALTGCFGDGTGSNSGTTTIEDTPPPPEDDNGVFHLQFEADGEATVEVPFPTLDSCRSPQSWMEGDISTTGMAVVRDATDGRNGSVLALTGSGQVGWSSQIDLGPACNTLRYDPWTTDPDPEGEVVEVRVTAGSVTGASVVVRQVRTHCLAATFYEGQPGSAWTALPGRGDPSQC